MTKLLDVSKSLVKPHPLLSIEMAEKKAETLADRMRELVDGPPKLTHGEVARRCGFSKALVGPLLRGNDPKLSTALKICQAFGVNLQWLATGEGPKRGSVAEEARKMIEEAFERFDARDANDRRSTIRPTPVPKRK